MSSRQLTSFEQSSSCFHHKRKGCEIVWYPLPKKDEGVQVRNENGGKVFVNVVMCKTHQSKLCYEIGEDEYEPIRCWWEIGGHYNELSQGYQAPYSLDEYPFDESNENPIESLI